MMRQLVGALALAAVVTTGAQAQYYPATFKATPGDVGGATDYAAYFGQFLSGNAADLGISTGTTPPTVFQIFCVDEFNYFNNDDTYAVYVTPMSSSDFSKTRQGAGSQAQYFAAANLASNMQYAYPGGPDNAVTDNLQYAIWTEMGMYVDPNNSVNNNYNAATVATDIATKSSGQGISANQWLVITMQNLTPGACYLNGDTRYPCEQEFIYNGPGRPRETTPEPGTMAMLAMGLVGMAGVGFRRHK